MQRNLKFISISSQNTKLEIRQQYSLQGERAEEFMELLKNKYPDLNGIMVLSTCNRTEIYFEAVETNKDSIIAALEDFLDIPSQKLAVNPKYSHLTENSLQHLSEVACGLKSAILGDKEIMGQIKQAYKRSLRRKMQGSLLERAMQHVIKIHKRVYNETDFKKGSTSFAYRSLKKLEQHFGKQNLANQKILLIGAGQIIQEVVAYATKCNVGQMDIANRSPLKAEKLAKQYYLNAISLESIFQQNDLSKYDAVITAVSGKRHFITPSHFIKNKNTLLIDLAVPANVDPQTNATCKVINIDDLSQDIQQTKKQQKEAFLEVEKIIYLENVIFQNWLDAYNKRKYNKEKVETKMKLSHAG